MKLRTCSPQKLPLPQNDKRHYYGEYKNVLLSDKDIEKLKDEFTDWEERVERLSEYMASSGKTYKNYLAVIRNWAKRQIRRRPPPEGKPPGITKPRLTTCPFKFDNKKLVASPLLRSPPPPSSAVRFSPSGKPIRGRCPKPL